jgi:hypothetical protein
MINKKLIPLNIEEVKEDYIAILMQCYSVIGRRSTRINFHKQLCI